MDEKTAQLYGSLWVRGISFSSDLQTLSTNIASQYGNNVDTTLINFGKGIGAMAYVRRVIENHMSEMLEIMNEEAEGKGLQVMSKEEIASLKFSQKVDRAKQLFPTLITPENYPNPFGQLYRLTSDGLHNLSEDESIVLFDQCRNVFEYVFSELRPHLKTRKKFLNDLQKLPKLGTSASDKLGKPPAPANAEAQKAG